MLNLGLDTWAVSFYSEVPLLNKIRRIKLRIRDFEKIGDYKYSFKASLFKRKLILDNFKDCKIIKKEGILNYLLIIISRKSTLFGLILSFILLHNLSLRTWGIDISGDYKEIEDPIALELRKNGVEISKYSMGGKELKRVENNISNYLIKDLEWLEIRRVGSKINIRYQKRRKIPELPSKRTSLYATKDGVIKYFNISSGVKHASENQFVRQGDLLVLDVIESTSGDLVNIGTLGEVYANTFYIIEVSKIFEEEIDEAEAFLELLQMSKKKIGENLSKGESIEKEMKLEFNIYNNEGYLKMYYMLLEDITI